MPRGRPPKVKSETNPEQKPDTEESSLYAELTTLSTEDLANKILVCRVGSEDEPASQEQLRECQEMIASFSLDAPCIVLGHGYELTLEDRASLRAWIEGDEPEGQSYRKLRQRAIAGGARLKPFMPKDAISEIIDQTGELEDWRDEDRVVTATDSVYEAWVNGFKFKAGIDGPFEVFERKGRSLEHFAQSLSEFQVQADKHFDQITDAKLRQEAEYIEHLESVKEFSGLEDPHTPDQKQILKYAESLGVRNCDVNFAAIKVLEAHGQPIGRLIAEYDGSKYNEMFTPDELQSAALKAMETPL